MKKVSRMLAAGFIATATALISIGASAAEAPAKPQAQKDQAGIIILDGKTPPTATGNVGIGIGAGGCAACGKTEISTAAKAKLTSGVPQQGTGIGAGGCAACDKLPAAK